jgi:hypothetical protein
MIRELRHQKIIELVRKQQGVTIQELARYLRVSVMTIHRDLRLLEEKGLLERVHGGVVIGRPDESQKESCGYCGKVCPSRTRLRLFSESGQSISACCIHCGMGLLRREREFSGGLTMDFLYETVIDLERGYFLFEPQIKVCCVPSVLVFADRGDAERMQMGFGGKLLNYEELKNCFVLG